MILDDKEIKISAKFVRIAGFKEEWDEDIDDPQTFVAKLKNSGMKADLFTFMQQLPESRPKFRYYMEWDSIAAIPITTYDNWIKNQIVKNSRKKINYAKRKGVTVKTVDFDDKLVEGIRSIYHETPILQGKPNRQYNTDLETTKKLNETFLDRAHFIGAFYNSNL